MSKPYKGDRKQGHSAILRNTSVSDPRRGELRTAAENADWEQVRQNGGPPCFHIEREGKFCLRAERWVAHQSFPGGWPEHKFVSLADLLAGARAAASPSHDDTKILDWLIFYAGRIVVHDSAETVTVEWHDPDGDPRETPILDCSPREAVQKAMEINAKL